MPNLRAFLQNSSNKAAIAKFICGHLERHMPTILKRCQKLLIAGGYDDLAQAKCVAKTEVIEDDSKDSHHEETDTRMISMG